VGVIKKMKPGVINHRLSVSLLFGAEEDSRSENPFEPVDDSGVVPAICWETEEPEQLDGAFEAYRAAPLFHRQCCCPDGNQPILAEWKTVIRMGDEMKKEFSADGRLLARPRTKEALVRQLRDYLHQVCYAIGLPTRIVPHPVTPMPQKCFVLVLAFRP
jgi:hypothetical protein